MNKDGDNIGVSRAIADVNMETKSRMGMGVYADQTQVTILVKGKEIPVAVQEVGTADSLQIMYIIYLQERADEFIWDSQAYGE